MEEIKLGRWRHFKGGEYEVIGIAKHSENIKRLMKNSESKLYLFGKKKHEQQEQKEEPEQPQKPKSLHNDD